MADKHEKNRDVKEEEKNESDNVDNEDGDKEDSKKEDTSSKDTFNRSNRRSSSSRPQQRGGRRNYQQRNYRSNRRGYFSSRRKVCPIRIEEIDWKKVDSLRYFIGEHGGIRPRRKTGATAKLQRKAAIAIKRARHMALLPFTGEHLRLMRHQRD